MKPIKVKDFKVGDWILLEYNKNKETRYIIIIKEINRKNWEVIHYVYNPQTEEFSMTQTNNIIVMKRTWDFYNLFKLNKVEIQKYRNEIMLSELEK